jgi:hypothetical protein
LAKTGDKEICLGKQEVNLPRFYPKFAWMCDLNVCRADDGHSADRDEAVSVTGVMAAIDCGVDCTVSHCDHRALPEGKRDIHTGHACNLGRPRPRRINDHIASEVEGLFCAKLGDPCAYYGACLAVQLINAVAEPYLSSCVLNAALQGMQQIKAVNRPFMDLERSRNARVQPGL